MSTNTRPITLLICALGGEGGGVLSEWLIETARHAGHAAQSTSIPGVAQRTGATTYYLEVFPLPLAACGGRRPVFSLNPVPGALDGLISSELLETARQIGNGLTSPQRTLIISSTQRVLTTQERMVPGDGRTDVAPLAALVREQSREHHLLDLGALARQAGTVVSAVMLGAIAGSGLFPFARADYEAAIRAGGDNAASRASLAGFALAFDSLQTRRQQAAQVAQWLDAEAADSGPAAAPELPAAVAQAFPPAVHGMLALGLARVREYQDAAYAELYLQRLRQVLAAEQAADPAGAQGHAATRECARWLALWMAYDDIIRVADLKSRARRWHRVQREVKPDAADLLQLHDYFKPGVPEFAAVLPRALGLRLQAWEARRVARGLPAWAMPIKVGTHTVTGMLMLRTLAGLRFLRRSSDRYAQEQALIERWLQGVCTGLAAHAALGLELALCGRLIKGYGSTHERGKARLLHVLDHLVDGRHQPDAALRAQAVAEVRAAALAEDSGQRYDQALTRHGAPPVPLREQPIRWMRRRPAGLTGGAGKP